MKFGEKFVGFLIFFIKVVIFLSILQSSWGYGLQSSLFTLHYMKRRGENIKLHRSYSAFLFCRTQVFNNFKTNHLIKWVKHFMKLTTNIPSLFHNSIILEKNEIMKDTLFNTIIGTSTYKLMK